jgi:hypothetical protein
MQSHRKKITVYNQERSYGTHQWHVDLELSAYRTVRKYVSVV